jgi:GxxExxY protein
MELLYRDESYAVIGACFEVYREKGNGFVEPVYQECLELECGFQKLPFSSQSTLRLSYKGVELKQRYIPDFLCHEKIIVELKAVKELTDEHRAQVLNYLKASGLRLGLLVNFGHYPKLEFERIIL